MLGTMGEDQKGTKELSGFATRAQHGGRQRALVRGMSGGKTKVFECGAEWVVRWGDAGMI